MSRRLLVIGAHSADFVWRSGGAIAVCTRNGGTAQVIALSYGERGESGELWKVEGQTVENVKKVRHAEAEKAAGALGAEFRGLDFGDYPLHVDADRLPPVVGGIPEVEPDTLPPHPRPRPLPRPPRPPRPPGGAAGARGPPPRAGGGAALSRASARRSSSSS